MFEISAAKREILEQLARRDWSPTDLAAELDKSTETVYNHLNDLSERGILTKRNVEAKTRPKTEYSIGPGFVQYITVLPDSVEERTIRLDENKKVFFRIWNLPQNEFHPYVEELWIALRQRDDVEGIGVYGSVARGHADDDSDIDLLVLAEDQDAATTLDEEFGSVRLGGEGAGSKLCMSEIYSVSSYRESLAHDSTFLETVRDELHVVYDPSRLLEHPEGAFQ